MEKIKIKFCDFWEYFHHQSNYFYNLLTSFYDVELCDDPEIVIYSCYGYNHLNYNCLRIFYTAENLRPDFSGCDFAISFDYNNDLRHYRLPLYALFMDQHPGSLQKLTGKKTAAEALNIWRSKTKFCCMIVSNPKSKKRIDFFEKLSAYKKVDSGGMVLNNVGGPVKDKVAFIKDYRFVFAFENSVYPGYTTEKILEPFISDCIPLYWGNPLIGKDFNVDTFLNFDEQKSEAEFIEAIIAVENDEEKAIKMLMEPKFINAEIPKDIDKERLLKFIEKIVLVKDTLKPVAKSNNRYVHFFKIKSKYYSTRMKGMALQVLRLKGK